jgi:ELWxxDGT repeat protein
MGRYFRSSSREHAHVESLECRRFLAVTAIKDLSIDPASNGKPAYTFLESNGIGFFVRFGELSISSLWRTDGVTATRIRGIDAQGQFQHMEAVEAGVVGLDSGYPNTVMRSDGTTGGTYSLGTVNSAHYFLETHPVAERGHYYFTDDITAYRTLYDTDGTTLWNRGRILGGLSGAAEYSDGIVLSGAWALYRLGSDGQLVQYVDQSTLVGRPGGPLNVAAGIIFLVGEDLPGNDEYSLWRTDGTAGNTLRLKESFGPDTSYVAVIGSDKQRALIEVVNRTSGRSLWSTDGTPAGTVEIQNLIRGYEYQVVGNAGGHTLFAVARDGPTPSQLWATDGTPQTTRLLTDLLPYPGYPTPLPNHWPTLINLSNMPTKDGITYFINSDPAHGAEIWRTDGTPQGTRLAFDLVPGPGSAGQPLLDGIVGERLIFNATIDGHLGLFSVGLRDRPLFPPGPVTPATTSFSSTLLSKPAVADEIDILDELMTATA